MLTRTDEENIWIPVRFTKYLNDCVSWIRNETQIQSVISKFCGNYCIFYCLYRSSGFDVRRVTRMFTKDTSLNDSVILQLCNLHVCFNVLFNKI